RLQPRAGLRHLFGRGRSAHLECRRCAELRRLGAAAGSDLRRRLMPDEARSPCTGAAAAGLPVAIPGNVFGYVLASSGWHQLALVALTVTVFLLEILPIELQRRIVIELTTIREYRLYIT